MMSPLRAAAALLSVLALPACNPLESDLAHWVVQTVASTEENFRKSRSLGALVEPADLELYRALLHPVFDMPEHPMVSVRMTDNLEVGPWPLTPYQLGSVSIRCALRGEEGWHVLGMPENHWVAIWTGRTMGFPKYMAEVRLERDAEGWLGEVRSEGAPRLRLEFRADGTAPPPRWKREGWAMDGPTLNLMPPGEGPEVRVVRSVAADFGESQTQKGIVRIFIAASEPWAGLVLSGTEATGEVTLWEGGVSLAPEH